MEAVARNGRLWNHQAKALALLHQGYNAVVATPTASGKSQVFMLWGLHNAETDPHATAIVFYPTKALVNDQLGRWKEAAFLAGCRPGIVERIDGDVPQRRARPDTRRRPHTGSNPRRLPCLVAPDAGPPGT